MNPKLFLLANHDFEIFKIKKKPLKNEENFFIFFCNIKTHFEVQWAKQQKMPKLHFWQKLKFFNINTPFAEYYNPKGAI